MSVSPSPALSPSPQTIFVHSYGFSCCPGLPAWLSSVQIFPRSSRTEHPTSCSPGSIRLQRFHPEPLPSPQLDFSETPWLRERQHHPSASSLPLILNSSPPPHSPHVIRLTDATQHLSFPSPLPPHCHCLNLGFIISCLDNSISLLIDLPLAT